MARLGRATLAADELHVTHSAVSRQVRLLEQSLGVQLFAGPKTKLHLTEAGAALLPALSQAFDQMAGAVRQIRRGPQDLHLAVNASLSVKWLIPRLGGFAAAEPNIRMQLSELPSHATSFRGADAVIRIVPSSLLLEPGVTGFIPNQIGPVLAPALLLEHSDVLAAPRLAASTHPLGWTIWAALAGVELTPLPSRPFAHLHFAMDAALAGLGVAILPWPLVADDLLAGRLVAPLGFRMAESAFAILASPNNETHALRRFRDWLVEQGAQTPQFRD